MKIKLSTNTLNSINTKDEKFVGMIPGWYNQYYHLEAGREHYRLLIYLASLYENINIADIGTNMGASALALSTNSKNIIYSIDIVDLKPNVARPSNCKFIIGNILEDSDIMNKVLSSKFVMLDIDHEYSNEIKIYQHLVHSGWKGLLCCDDIHLNDQMKRFWNEVSHPKIDITKYGHGSGTGLIIMDDTEVELL